MPMGRKRSGHHLSMEDTERNGSVLHGEDPGGPNDAKQLPNSSGHMASVIGRELCADIYAKMKGEANDEKGADVEWGEGTHIHTSYIVQWESPRIRRINATCERRG